jgi:4,5-DOPA dioxygenase extradiol
MMPAVFAGHGNPMYAITDNPYAREWRALGRALPKPKAVLAISAHWYVDEMAVTSRMHPETIHDFGGFPHELYQVRYPAPGDPELAARVRDRLAPLDVKLDAHWGLDHGTWSVLRHVFPDADVPVVQLAIDARRPPEFHFEVGQRLQPFREEGVLVFGSGNVVHNLQLFSFAPAAPFDWALRFETRVRELVEADDPGPWCGTRRSGATRSCRFRRRTTICRCSTSWARVRSATARVFRWPESTAAASRCSRRFSTSRSA